MTANREAREDNATATDRRNTTSFDIDLQKIVDENSHRNYFDLTADIVVGVDGSAESFAALRWALRQAAMTGQHVNAVYGWTYSWDMGPEPTTDEDIRKVRTEINNRLREWVDEATRDFDVADEQIKLTSYRSSGSAALLEIGANAQQIVVGRRSMGRVARWIAGSMSASLAEESPVPVTVIRVPDDDDLSVQDQIASSLTPGDQTVHYELPTSPVPRTSRPIVVGVDGSPDSRHALEFAASLARLHDSPLHVMYCWQFRDLGTVPGYETTVPPMPAAQHYADQRVRDFVASFDGTTLPRLPEGLEIIPEAFHIPAGKGLVSASRYARHIVVGSRGLSGLDAHFLGSISKQVLNSAECNLTIVH
ncbi:universal stress protein [Bifidobacterium choloepi]|uniref:Universal stress protein n=1 Tax=Bifidobacterium choloepi TaxID=2614131 RepID=A0A6I5N6D8_9BIFI|nr:universal stress protein [Bifidobacterium choloepi]NEG69361.1 universal stress protein [Bifidobacterium choloepi]